ncbi:MAG: DUF362 domain-containing protein [Candidatus Thorarchaeota archaeon]|nr:DUF362 domain-containing protein [Candidatus Thorarchaeota archaeon]
MTSEPEVYFGSTISGVTSRFANMSEKLDKILELLDLSTIKKRDKVAVKMHLGFNDGYQTVPVFFVRRVVEAVKKQGAFPFVCDNPTAVYNAAERGYTQETCGCPIIPVAGVHDGYVQKKKVDIEGVKSLYAAGALLDADVLVNLTHSKGHGSCGYGGAFKNIALGGYSGPTRWQTIHGVVQRDKYFDETKMTKDHLEKLRTACPRKAPAWNDSTGKASLEFYECDQCHGGKQLCIEADGGVTGWTIQEGNFDSFQELMAAAAKIILDSFDESKIFHLNFLLDITPFCDCMGMAMPAVIDDIGIVGSRDIVAVDTASLDLISKQGLNESVLKKIPERYMRVNPNLRAKLHPFQLIHGPYKDPYKVTQFGEVRGMGSSKYRLIEVLSARDTADIEPPKHQYESGPSFF